jgi:uncharacterized protein
VVRVVLFVILSIFVARAFWRLVDGVIEGLSGPSPMSSIRSGVQMVRDPVCGTYVVPSRAVAITDGRRQVFFCSAICRDKYQAKAG